MQYVSLLLAVSAAVAATAERSNIFRHRDQAVLSLFAPEESRSLEKIRHDERLLSQGSFLLRQPGGPMGKMRNPLKSIGDGLKDMGNKAAAGASGIGDELKKIGDMVTKPMMSNIDVMRAEMCLGRPRILKHKPCMKFMTKHCKTHTTGQGHCKEWWKMVADACYRAQKQGSDPKGYCEMLHTLKDVDTDDDGVNDLEDPFPYDPNEQKDTDHDGIGDNEDEDIDGDGVVNDADAAPLDPKLTVVADTDGDGVEDTKDPDIDGDGFDNEKDAMPGNPNEWQDSDADGKGDNKDAFPNDPECHSSSQPCPPGLASAGLAPGEATESEKEMDSEFGETGKDGGKDEVEPEPEAYPEDAPPPEPVPASEVPATEGAGEWEETKTSIGNMPNKEIRQLPNQGYNEYARGPPVLHSNLTYVGDFGSEWPQVNEGRSESYEKWCRTKQWRDSDWCIRYMKEDPRSWDH